MKRYEAENLRRMQEMYDFIAANPGCTMVMMCAHFQKRHQILRTPLNYLRNGVHIEICDGKRTQGGQAPSTYTVISKGRPTVAPMRKTLETPDTQVKRKIVPAKQIGLQRDCWTAAFFGPAQVAA